MASKKKVQNQVLNTIATIENEDQRIARVLAVRGGNMVDVTLADGSELLCSIPSRFSKKIWIKRGDYLIVELYRTDKAPSPKKESKIKASVVHILQNDSIKQLKKDKLWPTEFDTPQTPSGALDPAGLPSNPNRQPAVESDSEDGNDAKSLNRMAYDDDDDELDLPPNLNRRGMPPLSSSED